MPQKRSTRIPMRAQDSQVRNRNFLYLIKLPEPEEE